MKYIMNEEQQTKFEEALELIKLNKDIEAINILNKIYIEVPNNIRIRNELGKLLIKNYSTKDEGKQLLYGILDTEELHNIHYEAKYAEMEGNKEKAKLLYLDSHYYIEINNTILLHLGQLELENGNYKKSKDMLQELFETHEDDMHIVYLMGILEKYLGNRKTAKKYLDRVICKNDIYSKKAMLALADLETIKGNYDKASKYYDKLLNSVYYNEAVLGFAKINKEQGNIEIARDKYSSLLKTELNDKAILGLGQLKELEGKNNEAIEYFNKICDIEIKNEVLLELGKIALNRGDYNLSNEYFKNLLNSKLRNFAIYNLGILETKQNNNSIAREYFKILINSNALNKNDALKALEEKVLTKQKNSVKYYTK